MLPIFLALYSCNSASKKQLLKTDSYNIYLEDIKVNRKAIKLFDVITLNHELTAFYFHTIDSSIHFVRIDSSISNKQHTKFKLNKTLGKAIIEDYSKWLIVNYDTIFAVSLRNEKVYMFNAFDQIMDSFSLYPQNNTEDYICFSSDFGNLKYSNNKLIVPVSAGVNFDEEKKEYSCISGIIIDINTKSVKQFGRTSKKEILGVSSFTNPYDYFEIIRNQVYFSSEEESSMFVYNIDTDKTTEFQASSKFIDSIASYPDSLLYNREAKIKYSIHEPRYSRIGHIPQSNYLFRIAKHRTEIPKSDGYYKAEDPKSQFSIILIDSNNKIIDELLLGDQYPSDFVRTTNNEIILLNQKSDLKKQGLLCLDVFTIN